MHLTALALAVAVAVAMLVPAPAAAQDFLRDFDAFVEEMLPGREARPSPGPAITPSQPTPAAQRPGETAPNDAAGPPLPRPRPDQAAKSEEPQDTAPEPSITDRPYQTACPALLGGRLKGEMLEPIAEGICGLRSPLLVTAIWVNGREIALTGPVTTNCQMAGALADWVETVDLYARARLDSPIAAVATGTSMMCRNRYGAADGFVSEHGFANALDITGFTLVDGRSISVAAHWLPSAEAEGRLLRQAHGAACGRFTTVLGPEANQEHADHFHLDLGCHGQSCKAQICE